MPEKYRRVFVRVFSRLRQRVIWKFESESMPETVSSNVMLRKWLPQQDILGTLLVPLAIMYNWELVNE